MTAVVAVLAGGRGRRMGGMKPLAELAGRPLVEHVLRAADAAGLRPVVVAKPGTPFPPGLEVWHEPAEPVHPLLGIVTALERAALAAEAPLRATLEALGPATIALDDVAPLRSVDTPAELAAAREDLG